MRPLPALHLAVLLSACSAEPVAHLPFEGCSPGDTCSLGTVCTRATLSATGTGQGFQCAPGPCRRDLDCPSLDGRCVFGAPGDTEGQCYRRCTHGCRVNTACVVLPGLDGLCLPLGPEGPRGRVYHRCAPSGSACRDGTLCTPSLTPSREALLTCTRDACTADHDCPGYSVFEVTCREQWSPTGLVHRCARGCRTEGDCAAYGATCVHNICE